MLSVAGQNYCLLTSNFRVTSLAGQVLISLVRQATQCIHATVDSPKTGYSPGEHHYGIPVTGTKAAGRKCIKK